MPVRASAPAVSTPSGTSWLRPWLFWSLGGIFYCHAAMQRAAPSVMVGDLKRSFDVGTSTFSNLSAEYFYPYAAVLVPLGVLLDR
jgi:hypothetical protein